MEANRNRFWVILFLFLCCTQTCCSEACSIFQCSILHQLARRIKTSNSVVRNHFLWISLSLGICFMALALPLICVSSFHESNGRTMTIFFSVRWKKVSTLLHAQCNVQWSWSYLWRCILISYYIIKGPTWDIPYWNRSYSLQIQLKVS